MSEPTTRKRRAVKAVDITVPERGPWCPRCQYEYGVRDDERDLDEVVKAMTAMAFDQKLHCDAVPVADFTNVPSPVGKYNPPDVLPAVGKIIESIFQVDYAKEWKDLHDALTIGDKQGGRNDHATVARELDHAEDRARRAHRLFVNLKAELERFRLDIVVTRSAMRNEANADLQAEKTSGERSKQITDADVASKMAELHPDDYRRVEIDETKFKLAVEHAENFSERWNQRCRDLNTILRGIRGGGVD
jgi:hypothetical protein